MIGTGISVFIGRGGVSAKTFSRESQRTTLHVGVCSWFILCSRLSRWWLCASAAVGVLALAHSPRRKVYSPVTLTARRGPPRAQWRGQPPSARHRLERRRVGFGRHQCRMVGRFDRSAGAVNEEPFPGHPKDRDRTLVDAGMMVPTEQDPQIHVSGAVVFEPLGAVVDLAETRRGVAARILTMSVARDDRA